MQPTCHLVRPTMSTKSNGQIKYVKWYNQLSETVKGKKQGKWASLDRTRAVRGAKSFKWQCYKNKSLLSVQRTCRGKPVWHTVKNIELKAATNGEAPPVAAICSLLFNGWETLKQLHTVNRRLLSQPFTYFFGNLSATQWPKTCFNLPSKL